mmetsp:Transcript_10589/g.14636  ORF Transcript_10589/g.14636 Transcript_10589/m.14636 type:complete len:393 (+) Transcript_10589:55-1233(+)
MAASYLRILSRQCSTCALAAVAATSVTYCEEKQPREFLTATTFGVTAMALSAGKMIWDRRIKEKMVLVDCGSASTRITLYGNRRDKVMTLAQKKIKVKIGDALTGSEKARESFVKTIADAIRDICPSTPILIGATGGARQILMRARARQEDKENNNIAKDDSIRILENSFHTHFGSRPVSFRVLSGKDEGIYELIAARHLYEQANQQRTTELGVLAGGGASLQLGHENDMVSINLDARAGQDFFKASRTLSTSAKILDWECRRRVINGLHNRRSGSRFTGNFVVIEMASATLNLAISKSNDGTSNLSRDEAIIALKNLRARLEAAPSTTTDPITKRHLVYAIQLEAILDLCFESDSNFFMLQSTHQKKDPDLLATWPLGFYLGRYMLEGKRP